jgi:hypothetical protein
MVKYDVAFNPVKVAFLSFLGIMLQTNDVANLFQQFFRRFFHGMISSFSGYYILLGMISRLSRGIIV